MSLQSSLISVQTRLAEIPDEMEAISAAAEAANREMTAEELASIQTLKDEFDERTKTCQNLKAAVAAKESIQKNRISSQLITGAPPATQQGAQAGLPAVARHQRSKYFASNRDAYATGMWLGAVCMKKQDCRQWVEENGVGGFRDALEGGTDSLGGYSVPTPMAATIIELVEAWGVFRSNARNVTMTSQTLAVPKLDTTGMDGSPLVTSVFYPGEGGAITPGDVTFEQVLLSAVKYAQLTLLSTELNEDSVISVVDLLVRDFARKFAYSEDLNSFEGDGTATYGGITGIKASLQAGATITAANLAGITLGDFNSMAGRTKAYAGFSGRYYMAKQTYFEVVMPLLQAAGGTDMRQIEEGGDGVLNGDPVTFTQIMPVDGAGAQVAVYGDLDLGAYMGTRRQVSIRTLTELYAANDQLGVIGTLRSDSQIHSVGDATNAGAITNLIITA